MDGAFIDGDRNGWWNANTGKCNADKVVFVGARKNMCGFEGYAYTARVALATMCPIVIIYSIGMISRSTQPNGHAILRAHPEQVATFKKGLNNSVYQLAKNLSFVSRSVIDTIGLLCATTLSVSQAHDSDNELPDARSHGAVFGRDD